MVPSSTQQLAEALKILASHKTSLNTQVQLSLTQHNRVGKIDPINATAQAAAGITLADLDAALAHHQLTLGPLSPRSRALSLAEFLEGPDAGLRAIPGGRLEPLCLAITAVLPDGRIYQSHPSPRSAAGPDLVALLLGGQRRLGVIAEAIVRCFSIASARRGKVFSFPSADACVAVLIACLTDGVWFETVRIESRLNCTAVELNCSGTKETVDRDFNSIARRALDLGGQPMDGLEGGFAWHTSPGGREQEATWDAVADAVAARHPLVLHRLSLASAIAQGEIVGMGLDGAASWSEEAGALAAAIDPRGVLGGAP